MRVFTQTTELDSRSIFNKENLHDLTLWSLIITNIVTLLFAWLENWNILTLMWIYWFQSVVIGVTNIIRMLTIKEKYIELGAKTKKIKIPYILPKIFFSGFFAIHYGGFHLGYAIFLTVFSISGFIKSSEPINISSIAIFSGIFLVSHTYSLIQNKNQKQTLTQLMFKPYARIIPMHMTIIFAVILQQYTILLFLILKTGADAAMHVREHVQPVKPDIKRQINIPDGITKQSVSSSMKKLNKQVAIVQSVIDSELKKKKKKQNKR